MPGANCRGKKQVDKRPAATRTRVSIALQMVLMLQGLEGESVQ